MSTSLLLKPIFKKWILFEGCLTKVILWILQRLITLLTPHTKVGRSFLYKLKISAHIVRMRISLKFSYKSKMFLIFYIFWSRHSLRVIVNAIISASYYAERINERCFCDRCYFCLNFTISMIFADISEKRNVIIMPICAYNHKVFSHAQVSIITCLVIDFRATSFDGKNTHTLLICQIHIGLEKSKAFTYIDLKYSDSALKD